MKKLILLACMLFPAMGWADTWTLDNSQSTLNFVSVKKGTVGEVHNFKSLSGQLRDNHAEVSIDLASVETHVEIRNDRMQSLLFDVKKFATASIKADIKSVDVSDMKPGEHKSVALPVTLSLHGMEHVFTANLDVIALTHGAIAVSSHSPIIVKAADFGLEKGIEALRQIAKLPSIAQAVPVSFHLVFTH